MKTTQNKKVVWTRQYEYIGLLDSFKFMNASIDKMVQNLPSDQYTLLEQNFQAWPTTSVNLLKQKDSCSYCFVDSFEKLQETQLPPLEKWTNMLKQYEVTVSEDEYKRALEVFILFNCQNIGFYFNLFFDNRCVSPRCSSTLQKSVLWHIWTQLLPVLHGFQLVRRCNAQNMQTWTTYSNRKGTPRHGGKSYKSRRELGLQQAVLSRKQHFSFGLQTEEHFFAYNKDRRQ